VHCTKMCGAKGGIFVLLFPSLIFQRLPADDSIITWLATKLRPRVLDDPRTQEIIRRHRSAHQQPVFVIRGCP